MILNYVEQLKIDLCNGILLTFCSLTSKSLHRTRNAFDSSSSRDLLKRLKMLLQTTIRYNCKQTDPQLTSVYSLHL